MLTRFEKNVASFARKNRLFCCGDKILLAVSGGADSITLLHTMQALKAEGLFDGDFVCAHINHQLRGAQADADEEFVIEEAGHLKMPIETRRIETSDFARENKLSIETAARQLRLKSLLDIAKTNNCNCIATGHQKNDNAETILQRLSRGTCFRGLGGIWPKRLFADTIKFVRPLLCVSRDEILQYLNKRNLEWRIDHTNYQCTYRRNFVRHRLMPVLQQECKDSIVEQLFRLSQSARQFYDLVCERAEKIWPKLADRCGDKVKFNLEIFLSQPEPVEIELVREGLILLGSRERDLTQRHYEEMLRLAKQNISNKKLELPGGFTVRHEYKTLIFERLERKSLGTEHIEEPVTLKIPGKMRFGNCIIDATVFEAKGSDIEKFRSERTKFIERFDFDKLKFPLVIRLRKAGDRFWPLGLAGEKKLGKFITAAKIPQHLRRKMFVIADSEKIIWLWPVRISEQAKITRETHKILQLRITDVVPA
jgi:tRNA(Ile)-lysidine synthase